MKFVKYIAFALTLLLGFAKTGFSQTTNNNQQENVDSLNTTTLKVKGITCSMDIKMISANVEKVNGVKSCTVGKQGATTYFEVKYNPSLVTDQQILAAVEETGSCENPDERPYKVKK